jgi:hypothetical protein
MLHMSPYYRKHRQLSPTGSLATTLIFFYVFPKKGDIPLVFLEKPLYLHAFCTVG